MAVITSYNSRTYQPDFEQDAFYNELYGRRVYNFDAVSGAQIKVMLGDRVLIDDATAIQFALSQAKKPIYGYHSQYFDTVAPGVVIVQGRLLLNFIHQGYLRLLIEAMKDPYFIEKIDTDASRAAEEAKSGKTTYSGLPTDPATMIRYIKNYKKQQTEIKETQNMNRPDIAGGIIDIRIKYADDKQFDSVPEKVIYGVQFIGESQEISISGQPIQEMYEFIARRVS